MKKEKKIFIIGTHPFPLNRGVAAMCIVTIDLLKKYFPEYSLVICNYMLEDIDYNSSLYNQKYGHDNKIRVNNLKQKSRKGKIVDLLKLNFALCLSIIWKILKYVRINSSRLFCNNKILKDYLESDIIVDLKWGDQFTDIYSPYHTFVWLHESIIPVILNKPYILLPQTIGPFKNKVTYLIAKFILNKTKIIMIREKKSEDYILNMSVDCKKIFLIPDTAFYLDPVSPKNVNIILNREEVFINTHFPMVGITMRHVGSAGLGELVHENYIRIMVKIIEYMQKKYNCSILFIPHDGIKTSKHIYEDFLNKMKNKKNIFYLKSKDYSTEELRGIIGKCDILLSAYMHASVSALSMYVPTINFAYSYKAVGVFEMLGQEKWVCDLKNLSYDDLISKVEDAWTNKEKIRAELEARMKEVREKVMLAGELVKKVGSYS